MHALKHLEELEQVRSKIREIFNTKVKKRLILSQKLFYEFSNKSSKYLARALAAKRAQNTIHFIVDSTGKKRHSNSEIAQAFTQYYATLYNLPPEHKPQATLGSRADTIKEFLQQNGFKPLIKQQSSNIDGPLTLDEFRLTLKQMKSGKSPGPNGFSLAHYRSFSDILASPFLKTYNSLANPNSNHSRLLEAHISVIPEMGKDPTQVQNYRPISLLNVDQKIFAKILANRLLSFIPSLVDSDQVGFVPGREARDNTIKPLNIHHILSSTSQTGFLLYLDAKKAFNWLAWDYLEAVLHSVGLGSRLIAFILALYHSPTARVRVNGSLSNAFSISNGTRHECPVSTLIYIDT